MHLHMRFENGAEAHIHNSWLWPERRRRLTVVGTEAMAVYDELTQTVQLHRRRVNANLTVQDDGSEVVFHGDPEPLRHELEHFLTCVRDGSEPRSSGASAVAVIRVLIGRRADERARRAGMSDYFRIRAPSTMGRRSAPARRYGTSPT